MLPRISVVTIAYNVAEFVRDALDSALRQGYPNLEIILVNDGSDDTAALELAIAPYQHRIKYIKQPHRGSAAARNAGIRAATGEFVAMLDGDDVWEPDYIRVQLDALAADPRASLVYPNAAYLDGGKHLDGVQFADRFPSSGAVTFEAVCEGRCNIMRGTLARRAEVSAVGLYSTVVQSGCEDLELHLKLLKSGVKIIYHSQPIYRLRLRDGQLSSDESSMGAALIARLSNLDSELSLTPNERRALRNRIVLTKSRIQLMDGKRALLRGDMASAVAKLSSANVHLKSWKIGAAVFGARFAPTYMTKVMHEFTDQTRLAKQEATRAETQAHVRAA